MSAAMRGVALVVVAATLLAVVAACGSSTTASSTGREAFAMTGPFMANMDEYQALAGSPMAAKGERTLSGKAIFIDTRERRVAWDLSGPSTTPGPRDSPTPRTRSPSSCS